MLANRYKKLGFEFEIDADNEKQVSLICQYFTKDELFEKDGYSFQKGLMLFGNTGIGKSDLIKLCRQNPTKDFSFINCRSVSAEFVVSGDEGIQRFCTENAWCFDDFGSEQAKNYFGNKIEVMEEVMLRRYDRGAPFNNTHITTNKTAIEIRDRYGDRLADRFRQMFNIIEFPVSAKSRRK